MPRALTDPERPARVSPEIGELQQLARVFGHDLREQLSLLSVYNQLLRHRASSTLGPDAERLLTLSAAAVARTQELVADLIHFLRLAPPDGPQAPASSQQALDEALRALASSIQSLGACVVSEPLPAVRVSGDHVRQIFEQLIDNALKFHGNAPPSLRVACRRQNELAVFRVEDNGMGIEARHVEGVFRPLARLHGHTFPGTGMGLAVCRRITRFYGGTTWIESVPGRSTTACFSLPLGELEAS